MPLVHTANFSIAGLGGIKRSLRSRMQERFVTPQDFGAVGDGEADDTDALQACIDYACVNGAEANAHLCRPIRFPSGRYKISAPLIVNESWGVKWLGAGSNQVRIFWDPEADPVLITNVWGSDYYPVVELQTCNHQHIEGITFDASGVQNIVLHNSTVTFGHGYGDGHDGIYRDVHVTGAATIGGEGWGVSFSGGAMGSERTWIKCKFTNCLRGYAFYTANAINHFFYGCVFKDNGYGLYQAGQGSSTSFIGCESENNSIMDYQVGQGGVSVLGCHSTSPNFAAVSGYVAGNVHDSEDEGLFFTDVGSGYGAAVVVGNHTVNGTVYVFSGTKAYEPFAGISPGHFFVGNVFEQPDFWVAGLSHANMRGSARIWVDGVRVNPPTPSTWNPYDIKGSIAGTTITLSGGNSIATANVGVSATWNVCLFGWLERLNTGKWYFEITVTSLPSANWGVGIASEYWNGSDSPTGTFAGNNNDQGVTMAAVAGNANGNAMYNTGTAYTLTTDPTFANGSVIGVAFDTVARKVWFRHNGTWLRGDPGAGTDGCPMTGADPAMYPYAFFRPASAGDGVLTLNTGGTSFAGSLPSGFLAWG